MLLTIHMVSARVLTKSLITEVVGRGIMMATQRHIVACTQLEDGRAEDGPAALSRARRFRSGAAAAIAKRLRVQRQRRRLGEHGAETLGGVISRERNMEDLDVVMSVAGCYDETTMIVCATEEVYTGSV